MIAVRSAITGYAPTQGTVTYRSFGARYPNTTTAGHVNVTEESSPVPTALLASRSLEEDYNGGGYRECSTSTDVSYTDNTFSQEGTREASYLGESPLEEVVYNADQSMQQAGITRALVVYPVHSHSGVRGAPTAQAPHEIAQIRRSLSFLISFFGRLTVSVVLIIGSSIKQCLVSLRNQLTAFVAYLGTRTKGTILDWDEDLKEHPLFKQVRRHDLDVVKSEFKKKINDAIKNLDPDHPEVNVLERDEKTKGYVNVALSSECFSDLEAELLAYHSLIRDIQADPKRTPDIPLEKLRAVLRSQRASQCENGTQGQPLRGEKSAARSGRKLLVVLQLLQKISPLAEQLKSLQAEREERERKERVFFEAKARERVEARTHEVLQEALMQALVTITVQDAHGWFWHCGCQSLAPAN